MSEIKYYDGGARTPDGVFQAAMEAASPYAATADRSHENDEGILTGVPVTTGYTNIAATNASAAAQALTSATLAANTKRYVKVTIPTGANAATVRRIAEEAGAKIGAAAAKVHATAIAAAAGLTLTLNLSRSDVYTCLIDVKTVMDERGCPAEGRVLVMPGVLLGELLKDARVTEGTDAEINGTAPKFMGFELRADEGLDGEMLAYHSEAVTLAQIVTAYERTATQLSAEVAAGAVVVSPDHVCEVTVS